jgi:transcriptional regulator with XRE-family HTH domain
MEQTLGKRIMQYRKNKGLTQDKLAEALGVTPQAVSKWENDQSCPDISTLPKLAEIFGITTDELLGHETQTVHQAQIVDNAFEEENEPNGFHIQKGDWEFKYEAGKQGAIFFALLVLSVGILALLNETLHWNVSFWSILWPTALLVFGIQGLCKKFSFFAVGSTLFGGYFLLDNLNILHFDLGDIFFPVIVILFGLSLLADALRKPKKHRFFVNAPKSDKSRADFTVEDTHFSCDVSFGDSTQYVSLAQLSQGEIDCSFCNLTVDLSGCATVSEDCRVEADCSFGNLTILVPSRYQIIPATDTSFGDVLFEGTPDETPVGKIRMDCDVSFGQITIRYI